MGSEERDRKVRHDIRKVDSARAVLKENGLPGRERTTNNVCPTRMRPYSSY